MGLGSFIWYGGGAGVAVLLRASDGGLWLSHAGSITEILPSAEIPSGSTFNAAIQVSPGGSWILSYVYLLNDVISTIRWGVIKTSVAAYGPWPMYSGSSGAINGALSLKRLLGYRSIQLDDPLGSINNTAPATLNLDYIGSSSTTPSFGEMSVNAGLSTMYVGAPEYALEGLISGDRINWLDLSSDRRVFTYNSHTYSGGIFSINVTYVGVVSGAGNTINCIILVSDQFSGEVRSITRQYTTEGLTLTRTSAGLLLGLSSLLPATSTSGFNNGVRLNRAIRDESDLHGLQEIASASFEHVDAAGNSTQLSAINYSSFGSTYQLCRYDHPTAYIARPPSSYSNGINTANIASLAVDLDAETIAISGTTTAEFLLPENYLTGGWSILKFYLTNAVATYPS